MYVRSRIAYDGCFATHYHHYSKCKKEIALSLQYKLKQIPPQRGALGAGLCDDEKQPLGHFRSPEIGRIHVLKPQRKRKEIGPPVLHNKMSSERGRERGNALMQCADSGPGLFEQTWCTLTCVCSSCFQTFFFWNILSKIMAPF